jgi:hypothetical protein
MSPDSKRTAAGCKARDSRRQATAVAEVCIQLCCCLTYPCPLCCARSVMLHTNQRRVSFCSYCVCPCVLCRLEACLHQAKHAAGSLQVHSSSWGAAKLDVDVYRQVGPLFPADTYNAWNMLLLCCMVLLHSACTVVLCGRQANKHTNSLC